MAMKLAIIIYVLLYEEISYICFPGYWSTNWEFQFSLSLDIVLCFLFPSSLASLLWAALSHSFNNRKCYACRFLCKNFFYVSPLAGLFLKTSFRTLGTRGFFSRVTRSFVDRRPTRLRPLAEDTSGETENRAWKASGTQGKVSLAAIFLGELSSGNAIGLTAQYLPWRGGEMSSFEIIPTHAFNFFVKYAIFESGNSFIMNIIFPWSKILSVRNFTLSRFCSKLFKRAMRNNLYTHVRNVLSQVSKKLINLQSQYVTVI